MRILWHMPTLRRRGCGLSIRAIELAKRLHIHGHLITFVVEQDKTDIADAEIEGMPLIRTVVPKRRPLHWCLQARSRREAARWLVQHVLAGHGPAHDLMISCQPEVVAAYTDQPERRPVVYVCVGTTLLHDAAEQAAQRALPVARRLPFALDRRLKHVNEAAAFTTADAMVFDSNQTRELVIAAYGAAPGRSHTIYGGVDENHFRPPTPAERRAARETLGISENGYVVVWTGRLSPEKNLELLLRAVACCRTRPERVVLVGDGPLKTELVQLAVSERLGGSLMPDAGAGDGPALRGSRGSVVEFVGDQADVRPFLHAADVFAFPSRGESFGGAMVEAMACGLACVALRPDGRGVRTANAEIIEHQQSGLLAAEPTPQAFAAGIELLGVDADLRRRLGRAAQARAREHFTWAVAARKLGDLISKLVPVPPHSDIQLESGEQEADRRRLSAVSD